MKATSLVADRPEWLLASNPTLWQSWCPSNRRLIMFEGIVDRLAVWVAFFLGPTKHTKHLLVTATSDAR